jgi:hypothetical protein
VRRRTAEGPALGQGAEGRQVFGLHLGRQHLDHLAALDSQLDDAEHAAALQVLGRLQVLHTTPWLEMRDHWGLDGQQVARAAGWAIRTLVADLKARGSLPLDQDPPAKDGAGPAGPAG